MFPSTIALRNCALHLGEHVHAHKLENKYGRVKTGLFIATGGFTDEFKLASSERKLGAYLVVTIDHEDIDRWIDADDRVAFLNEMYKRSVFE